MAKTQKTTKVMQATDLKGQMNEYEKTMLEQKLARLRSKLEVHKGQNTFAASEDIVRREADLVEMEKTLACIKRDHKEVTNSIGYKVEVRVNKVTSTIKGWFAKKPVAMQTTT